MSEAQQIQGTLEQIDKLLIDIELRINNITGQKGGGGSSGGVGVDPSLRKEIHTVMVYLTAIERFSGSDNISDVINKLQQAAAVAVRLQMLLISIQTINAAIAVGQAVTPWGWAALGANAVGVGISLGSLGQ